MLAGVSVDYYVRLERGNLAGASESVLDAARPRVAARRRRTTHLFDLARAATPARAPAGGRPRSRSAPACSGCSTP